VLFLVFSVFIYVGCLQNGVRGLMLDMYDFGGDVWLCHSLEGKCYNFTAFVSYILCRHQLFGIPSLV
jgi:hypothetical protein